MDSVFLGPLSFKNCYCCYCYLIYLLLLLLITVVNISVVNKVIQTSETTHFNHVAKALKTLKDKSVEVSPFHSIVYVHPPPTYLFRTSTSFTDRL